MTLAGPQLLGVEISTTYGIAVLRANATYDDAAAYAESLASDTITPLLNAAGVTRQ